MELFNSLPGVNFGTALAAMWMVSPVLGFRPVRAFDSRTENVPKPEMTTRSRDLRAVVIPSSMELNICSAFARGISPVAAIAATRSLLVTVDSPSGKGFGIKKYGKMIRLALLACQRPIFKEFSLQEPPVGREYPLRPIVGVGAIILRNSEVLVVRRGRPPRQGEWSVPGGAVKLGETLEEACRREILEETGLSVEVLSRCAVLDRVTRDEWGRVRYHYVLIDFICRPAGGALRAGGDVSEAMWHPLADLLLLQPMTPGTAKVILEAAETLRQGAPAG